MIATDQFVQGQIILTTTDRSSNESTRSLPHPLGLHPHSDTVRQVLLSPQPVNGSRVAHGSEVPCTVRGKESELDLELSAPAVCCPLCCMAFCAKHKGITRAEESTPAPKGVTSTGIHASVQRRASGAKHQGPRGPGGRRQLQALS